jgi:LysR family transcriptional regulator, transcriptional activator of the cysJI operon
MDISHLSTYCVVVEAGSISRAAKELYVTQPAISQKIQELEEYYQVQLLERTNRGIKPTEIGLFLYSEAQKVIALMANIQRELDAIRNPSEELSVGASSTIGNFALPCTMLAFRNHYPGYSVSIDIDNSDNLIKKMIGRRIEIGLVEGPLKPNLIKQLADEGIMIKKIAQTKLILIAKYEGKYKDLNILGIKELIDLPFITREIGSGIRASIENVFAEKGFSINDFKTLYELNTINSIVSAVTSDIGLALLPGMSLRKEIRYKIVKPIRVKELKFKHELNLLYHINSRKQSYKAFIELINSKDRGFC